MALTNSRRRQSTTAHENNPAYSITRLSPTNIPTASRINSVRQNARMYSSSDSDESHNPKTRKTSKTPFINTTCWPIGSLTCIEENMFDLISAGQLSQVKGHLNQLSPDQFNKLSTLSNVEGDTIFHTAVRRQDEVMLDYLLNDIPNVTPILYDILLLSIKESNLEITQKIWDHIKPRKLSDLPKYPNSEFDPHLTPLMLAAIVGNYDIIALFGASGQQFHPKLTYMFKARSSDQRKRRTRVKLDESILQRFLCCCCTTNRGLSEDLQEDYRRLHEYQAMASPEMLCYNANTATHYDPILKAFKLIEELEFVKIREVEYYNAYEEMIGKLKVFTVQLLSQCRNAGELEILLSRQNGYHGHHDRYPRVNMAMELKLSEFVSHSHTQRTMYMEWAGNDWKDWRYYSSSRKMRSFLTRLLLFPFFLLFVMIEQGNAQGRKLSAPISKCMYACISQIIFVGLSVTEHIFELGQPNERKPTNTYIELILVIFVLGQIRALARQFCFAPKIFFRVPWNWFDIVNHFSYICCFTCWGYLYMQGQSSDRFPKREPIPRQYWEYYDPLLIADAFLTIGTIMACGRFLRFIQLHSVIGPIQVALGQMCANILNFIIFFFVALASFTLGITILYAPYKGMINEDTGEEQKDTFTHQLTTFNELMWNLFGMASADSGELLTIPVNNTESGRGVLNYEHYVTEWTGKFLFSIYAFFGPTILFSSMLVAFMSNTFGQIVEENEINWKFHRAQMWVYFSRADVLPPPLNLFPNLWNMLHFCRAMKMARKNPGKYFCTCNCATCSHYDLKLTSSEKLNKEEIYFNLIKVLIKRYFRSKVELGAKSTATSEDMETLNEEVNELKSLIEDTITKISNCQKSGYVGGAGDMTVLPSGSQKLSQVSAASAAVSSAAPSINKSKNKVQLSDLSAGVSRAQTIANSQMATVSSVPPSIPEGSGSTQPDHLNVTIPSVPITPTPEGSGSSQPARLSLAGYSRAIGKVAGSGSASNLNVAQGKSMAVNMTETEAAIRMSETESVAGAFGAGGNNLTGSSKIAKKSSGLNLQDFKSTTNKDKETSSNLTLESESKIPPKSSLTTIKESPSVRKSSQAQGEKTMAVNSKDLNEVQEIYRNSSRGTIPTSKPSSKLNLKRPHIPPLPPTVASPSTSGSKVNAVISAKPEGGGSRKPSATGAINGRNN